MPATPTARTKKRRIFWRVTLPSGRFLSIEARKASAIWLGCVQLYRAQDDERVTIARTGQGYRAQVGRQGERPRVDEVVSVRATYRTS